MNCSNCFGFFIRSPNNLSRAFPPYLWLYDDNDDNESEGEEKEGGIITKWNAARQKKSVKSNNSRAVLKTNLLDKREREGENKMNRSFEGISTGQIVGDLFFEKPRRHRH